MFRPVSATYQRVGRYREVAGVLTRHGFGYVLDQSGLRRLASWPFWHSGGPSSDGVVSAPRRLRRAIEELGPTAIKLGQFLSTRPDLLPPEFIRELETLQDALPPFPCEQVRAQIQAELGRPLEELYGELEPEPIAAASLAQVHRARLPSGEEVVVKVQRPGIEGRIEVDLAILADLAAALESRAEWARLSGLVDLVDELGRSLRDEFDFAGEGRSADVMRSNSAGESGVRIPRVHWDRTARRVLTLERVGGIKVGDAGALRAAGLDPEVIARSFARTLLRQMLVDGFFHGDPHPGNVLVDRDGRIVLMDFGMVGELDERMRADLVALVTALVRQDVEGMTRILLALNAARVRVDVGQLRRDLARLLRRYYRTSLREVPVGEAIDEGLRLARRHHLRLPSDLMLLAKALVTMEGIVACLDPGLSIVEVAEPFGRELLARRLSPQHLQSALATSFTQAGHLAMSLPQRVASLLEMAERGELTVRVESAREAEPWPERETLVNRLALALVVAAGSIGTALLFQAAVGPAIGGMPLLALGALLTTTGLGALLVLGVLRSGRL